MKKKSAVFFVLSIVIIGVLAYLGAFGFVGSTYEVKPFSKTINRGLDLQGGVSVVQQITDKNVSNDTMQRTIQLLDLRVNKMGVSETSVVKEGNDKIRVEVPGKYSPDEVLKTIGKTGELKFVAPDNTTVLTGSDVKSASVGTDPQNNQPLINLQLSDSGTKKFAAATEKYLGQTISIYMDDEVLTSPTVNSVISDGKAQITGSMTIDEAKRQADIISAGALPVTLKTVEVKTVSATLGANALPMSVRAGVIGIAIVLVLMFIWFRRPGIMADIALILYVFLVLLVFSGIGATLTLSGIAGFLLTVGMAVDANVLIFARIKEELKAGKSIKSSTRAGFQNAMSSIVDSNINTIIAGVVLYFLGTGVVKGFALTLIIGVLVSLFTALFITKHLLNWAIDIGIISSPKHFGVKRG